jgi:hypothetical protein
VKERVRRVQRLQRSAGVRVDLAVQSNFFKLWSDPFHFDSPGIQAVSALGNFLTALLLQNARPSNSNRDHLTKHES